MFAILTDEFCQSGLSCDKGMSSSPAPSSATAMSEADLKEHQGAFMEVAVPSYLTFCL